MTTNPYMSPYYVVRRDLLNFWHRKFRVYDPNEQLAFYCEMKAFKLKEDIRIYADESKTQELLVVKARQILDISPTFDVWDATNGAKVGALRRAGIKSIARDEWAILSVELNGQPMLEFKQNFNPFVLKLNLDFSRDTNFLLDRRLGVAAGLLLASIEGRQSSY